MLHCCFNPVYGELLFRQATWHATLLHPFLYVIDFKRALNFGEAQPSQTWRTFLTNHLAQTAAIDFFTVPTATFRVLFVFVVLAHERRRVVHFG